MQFGCKIDSQMAALNLSCIDFIFQNVCGIIFALSTKVDITQINMDLARLYNESSTLHSCQLNGPHTVALGNYLMLLFDAAIQELCNGACCD